MAWYRVCTLTDTSGIVYTYEIDSRAYSNTRTYNGQKTTTPGKTSSLLFKYPSGAKISDGDSFWLFVSAAYGTTNYIIRRVKQGTSEVIYARYEMYHQWSNNCRVEFDEEIPFFNDVSIYSNWSYYRKYTPAIYEKWIGGKFPSTLGRWRGLHEINGTQFSYPKHDIGGEYQDLNEENVNKELKFVEASKFGEVAVSNYPEIVKPVTINFATVYENEALIRTIMFEDSVWQNYSPITLYGKIGGEPACDNTDDVVQNVGSSIITNKIEVPNLTQNTNYYFCLKLVKTEDSSVHKSNVLRVFLPHTPINVWLNVDQSSPTVTTFIPYQINDNYLAAHGNEMDFCRYGGSFTVDNANMKTIGTPINLQTYIDIGKELPVNGSSTATLFSNSNFNVNIKMWNHGPTDLELIYFLNGDSELGQICYPDISADYFLDGENIQLEFLFAVNEKYDPWGEEDYKKCGAAAYRRSDYGNTWYDFSGDESTLYHYLT